MKIKSDAIQNTKNGPKVVKTDINCDYLIIFPSSLIELKNNLINACKSNPLIQFISEIEKKDFLKDIILKM